MKKILRKITDIFTSGLFILFVGLFGLIPFRLLYILSDFLAFLLRKVFRYRLRVIRENLSLSDLKLKNKQENAMIKKIYSNLSDIIVESLKSFTMSRSSVLKRHKVRNPEIVDPFYAEQKSIILVTGHICNWEWGSLSAGLQTPYHILGFYKKLKNPYVDRFLRWSRSRFGTTLASIKETSQSFERQKGIPTLFLMAADQSPTKLQYAYWINFMGRDTAFLHGPEKHARNNEYPVIFSDIERVKRGYYEMTLSVVVEKPTEIPAGEITARYALELETVIRQKPEKWLWSHKRWKHQRKAD
ncbi:MAG: lysophospholipid acyltransferase family protein [Bacteroidales bacterium]|nr:lysophospholipid acyltransferase family protein [Bacteroidales bacterium]